MSPRRRLALHRDAVAALRRPRARRRRCRPARASRRGGRRPRRRPRWAPRAAERAAAPGAHREAAEQYARALRFADALPPEGGPTSSSARSYECYMTAQFRTPRGPAREALAVQRRVVTGARGRRPALALAAALVRRANRGGEAERPAGRRRCSRSLPPATSWRWPTATCPSCGCWPEDTDDAIAWGERAIALAERLGEDEILVHALNNVGSAQYQHGDPDGQATLERSLDLALRAGLEEHAARAYSNLRRAGGGDRDYAAARRLSPAWASTTAGPGVESGGSTCRAGWPGSSSTRAAGTTPPTPRPGPALPATRPRPPDQAARRDRTPAGAPRRRGGLGALDEACAWPSDGRAAAHGPVAAARAEAAGSPATADLVRATEHGACGRAAERRPWAVGELAVWRRRAGLRDELRGAGLAEPWASSWPARRGRRGRWPRSAARTRQRWRSRSPTARRCAAAMEELERLGARARRPASPACCASARRPRPAAGPRAAPARTRRADARELEVLELVARGTAERARSRSACPVREDRPPPRVRHPAQARGPDAGRGGGEPPVSASEKGRHTSRCGGPAGARSVACRHEPPTEEAP